MAIRDTRTGDVLEQMVLPALRQGGYEFATRVEIGRRLGLGRHIVDVVAKKDGKSTLVSLKWQQVSGTAEQKVPFEVICLADAIKNGGYEKAYLVLGGEGWTLREFYTRGGLTPYLSNPELVTIMTLEGFVALANQAGL